jgi:NarL family two-component system response regulator LiaR
MIDRPIKVLVVDDHAVVRRGVRALLATEPGIEVVGEASDGLEAVEQVERLEPDVVVMDLVMPKLDGVEALNRIRERRPQTHVLVLTSFGSDSKLFPAVKAGATGYLLKDTPPEDLVRAIRDAAAGRSTLHPAVARRVLLEMSREKRPAGPDEPLTPRERELLGLVARGLANDQIADELCISPATVRTHISHILFKLNLDNRTQAALYALREGLASLDDLPG